MDGLIPQRTCFSRILLPMRRTTSPRIGAGVSAHAALALSISFTYRVRWASCSSQAARINTRTTLREGVDLEK